MSRQKIIDSNVHIIFIIFIYICGGLLPPRAIQAVAKALGLPKYCEKKAIVLPRILAHDWDKVNAKQVLLML